LALQGGNKYEILNRERKKKVVLLNFTQHTDIIGI
jgi:hypothetical protein